MKNVRLVAADIDGTLTQQGKLTPALLQALEDLAQAGIAVLVVTGRSAGWVSGLATYLPILGAIAENGGLFYSKNGEETVLNPISDRVEHRQRLAQMFQQLQVHFPKIQESPDNRFRVTDWTFDNQNLSYAEIQQLATFCQKQNWGFTYSAIQCHIKPLQQHKGVGLLTILQALQYSPEETLTVGDSPNDESLFWPEFPCSVGVANILAYSDQMHYLPAYVTAAAESLGFCELTRYLLHSVKHR